MSGARGEDVRMVAKARCPPQRSGEEKAGGIRNGSVGAGEWKGMVEEERLVLRMLKSCESRLTEEGVDVGRTRLAKVV